MEVVGVWLLLSAIAAGLAHTKGRSAVGVFFLSILLTPLVGLITVALMAKRETIDRERIETGRSATHRLCPACAEIVRHAATVCSHCGRALTETADSTEEARTRRLVEALSRTTSK